MKKLLLKHTNDDQAQASSCSFGVLLGSMKMSCGGCHVCSSLVIKESPHPIMLTPNAPRALRSVVVFGHVCRWDCTGECGRSLL